MTAQRGVCQILDLDHHLGTISSGTPQSRIEQDIQRLSGFYFGTAWAATSQGGVLLELGGGSGLHALAAAHANPSCRVAVVEPDAWLHRCLTETFERAGRPNILAFRGLEEALAALGSGRPRVDVLKVDLPDVGWPMVKRLLMELEVGHVAGVYESAEVPGIEVYRASRRHAGSFHWRPRDEDLFFAGKRSTGPEVSLVVPAYQVADYLGHCLESLLAQTLESKEVIVVEDGSPDQSGKIAEEWAERYPEIVRVIRRPNGGAAVARNTGLAAARGDYVGFVDGDDWCDAPMYEALFTAAVLNGAEVAQCGYRRIGGGSDRLVGAHEVEPAGFTAQSQGGQLHSPLDLIYFGTSMWRQIYRLDFIRANGLEFPVNIRLYEDCPFQIEVLCRAKRAVVIPNVYYNYRIGREGQAVSVTDRRQFVHFEIFDHLRERIGSWAGAEIQHHLAIGEIRHHLWAIARVEPRYRGEYLREVARQLYSPRPAMSRLDVLRDAWRASRLFGLFAAKCFVVYLALRAVGAAARS
jgi:glycosyltransferase involved in cell wall biosynthesis